MLISFEDITKILLSKNININGAFHVGAHECEELDFYNNLSLNPEDIIWVDAISGTSIITDFTDHYQYCNIVCVNKNSDFIPF